MKVLMISPKASGEGGIARHVSTLSRKLSELGHEVTVISCTGMGWRGVKDVRVNCLSRKGLANVSFMFRALSRISGKYDVVHGHNAPSVLPVAIAKARKKVITIHGPYSRQVSTLLKPGAKFLEWLTFRVAEVTVVSRATQRWYRERGYEPLYVPNAIDPEDFRGVDEVRLFNPQVAYVGRMSWEKGVDLLVQAVPKVEAGFVLVGGGPMLGHVREKLEGLENVVITGEVSRREALGYIKGSDLLVLPSRSEGLSTVLLEAGYLEVPVVASSIEENREVLNGYAHLFDLHPGREVENLVKALKKALSEDNGERVKKLKERIVNNYTWDAALKRYLRVYDVGAQEG